MTRLALIYLLSVNLVSIGMFGIDKWKARRGSRRIPEKNLHLVGLAGGFLGGFAGIWLFRHKRRKRPFLFVYALAAIASATLIFMILKEFPDLAPRG